MEYVRGGRQKAAYDSEEVVTWPCPLCDAEEQNLIKVERDVLGIVRCRRCSLIRVNPRLRAPEEIYQGDPSVYEEEFKMVRKGSPHHRDPNYRRILDLLKRWKPKGRFLDVGTNAGTFLRLARDQGWELEGVEPSACLAEFARDWWGLKVRVGFLEGLDLPESDYDLVTLTDVFEHVVNPKEVLAAARRVLKPDGLLFLKVPNARFNMTKFKVRGWLGRPSPDDFDAYEHVCHYDRDTLRAMVESGGFRVERIYAEAPVQLPVWQEYVGHYYAHSSPWALSWKVNLARALLFRLSQVEQGITGRVGWLAPNLGCLATPS